MRTDKKEEVKRDSLTPYVTPPDGYTSPSIDPGCLSCGEPVIFTNVIGGQMWKHLNRADHEAVMGRWWDTQTGEWVEGNPIMPSDRAPKNANSTPLPENPIS